MCRWLSVSFLVGVILISSCGPFSSALPNEFPLHNSDDDNNQFLLLHSRGIRESNPTQLNTTSVGGGSSADGSTKTAENPKTDHHVSVGTFLIPAKPPSANYTKHTPSPGEESFDNLSEDDKIDGYPGQPKFDENAVQRASIVVAFLAFVVLVYLGAKFMLTKKTTKVDKRYGRIESEIDLLDEMEGAEETEEEEELFDVNATRRSNNF